jgi:hypothetical protein
MYKSLKTWMEMTSAGSFLIGVFQGEPAALAFSMVSLAVCVALASAIERNGL